MLGVVTGHHHVIGLGDDFARVAPDHGAMVMLDPATEAHRVVHVDAREFPRCSVLQPGIGILHLAAGADFLCEHAVFVANSIAKGRDPERRHRVQKAGGESAQPAVAQRGVGFAVRDVFKPARKVAQSLDSGVAQVERSQRVGQRASHQELHRQVADPARLVLALARLRLYPAPGQFAPRHLCERLHQFGRRRAARVDRQCLQQLVADRVP